MREGELCLACRQQKMIADPHIRGMLICTKCLAGAKKSKNDRVLPTPLYRMMPYLCAIIALSGVFFLHNDSIGGGMSVILLLYAVIVWLARVTNRRL